MLRGALIAACIALAWFGGCAYGQFAALSRVRDIRFVCPDEPPAEPEVAPDPEPQQPAYRL